MRSFLRDHWKAIVVILLLVVLATFTVTPGAAPSLAERLRAHVTAIASEQYDNADPTRLERAARYIETALRSDGYAVRRQAGGAGGQALRNIEVSVANLAPHARPERIFIVGTHYGESATLPDGTGSGPAAVLELARLLKNLRPSQGTEVRFVFFADGAPPWFPGRALDAGNFIAFVGTLASARPVQQALSAFQRVSGFPAHGLAAPAYVQGVTLSGHAATQRAGDPAILITDTAFGRYPYFETQDGTDDPPSAPDALDYAGVARVVGGLAHTIEALAAGRQS